MDDQYDKWATMLCVQETNVQGSEAVSPDQYDFVLVPVEVWG